MTDEMHALEQWAGSLLSKLSPSQRRAIAQDIGRALRQSQKGRITAQTNPDESAYAPRKPRQVTKSARLREKQGKIKRGAMFVKLKTARFMKLEADAQGIGIGFTGRVARLARIHQFGETAEVTPGGRSHRYPVRQTLGFTNTDRTFVRDRLLDHLVP